MSLGEQVGLIGSGDRLSQGRKQLRIASSCGDPAGTFRTTAASAVPHRGCFDALFSLPSPFGRFWALFNLQQELNSDMPNAALRHLALATAEEFSDPRTVAANLLMLIGYADQDREVWIRRAVDISRGLDTHDRMNVLAVVARMAADNPGIRRLLIDEVCELPTLDSIYTALLMLCRTRLDLTGSPADSQSIFHAAVSQRLRFAAPTWAS